MVNFFAYISRMKHIKRWGLMRNTEEENIKEHSLDVAVVAHALALIGNRFYGKRHNAEHIMALAVFHETGEVITGDLATPIKYFNPEIKQAYGKIERLALEKMLSMLPEALREDYRQLLFHEGNSDYALVKAADKLCAYIKCLEEIKSGNQEFAKAKLRIEEELYQMEAPEVQYFLRECIAGYTLTLDELN